jgi:hypothetical protein
LKKEQMRKKELEKKELEEKNKKESYTVNWEKYNKTNPEYDEVKKSYEEVYELFKVDDTEAEKIKADIKKIKTVQYNKGWCSRDTQVNLKKLFWIEKPLRWDAKELMKNKDNKLNKIKLDRMLIK